MFLYTPLADRIATRMFDKPPMLELFRAIQQSRAKLIAGIAIAFVRFAKQDIEIFGAAA
jgi:hypothetical protein